MTTSQSLNLYNISLRYFKNENDAKLFVTEIEAMIDNRKDGLATKEDIHQLEKEIAQTKTELNKSIYFVGLVQFLAITASVVGILSFILKK